MKNLAVVRAVDAAEARGDVVEAMELIEADLRTRREDELFWHPERLRGLMQLALFGGCLPSWAWSRWILAQAARCLHESHRAPARRAFDLAEDVGGPASRYGGVDELDSSSLLLDHDWVYRQALLYDEGALEAFLSEVASSELVDSADAIQDWVGAPMSALQLADESPQELSWLDLSSDEIVKTPNIGSASELLLGDCVLGRVVPTTSGQMLESVPLPVPRQVADEVAAAPDDWPDAVRRGRERSPSGPDAINTEVEEFGLLDDVPSIVSGAVLETAFATTGRAVPSLPSLEDVAVARQALVRLALDGTIEDQDWPVTPWPTLGMVLMEPSGIVGLLSGWRPGDESRYLVLSDQIAEPAAGLCRNLGGADDRAA